MPKTEEELKAEREAEEVKRREELTSLVNEIVHKAISARDKRLSDSVTKLVEDKIAGVSKLLDERLPGRKDSSGGEGDGGEKKKIEMPDEYKALVAKAQKDAADAKRLAEKHAAEAKEERDARSRQEEITTLTGLLTGSVKPPLFDMVVKDLHSTRIVRDKETGKILWRGDKDDELLPLKDGVEAWKKTDAGKEVAPPRDVSGSGGRGASVAGLAGGGAMTLETLGGILSGVPR